MMWATWWVWVAAGIALGVLEVVIPGFIFLGFALGAVATGLVLLVGQSLFAFSLPALLLIFAFASLVSWLALRAIFKGQRTQVKIWDKDINE